MKKFVLIGSGGFIALRHLCAIKDTHNDKDVGKFNIDHRYGFTPYTLAKLLTGAGFVDIEVQYLMRNPHSIGNLLKKNFHAAFLLARHLAFKGNIVIEMEQHV